MNKKTMDRIVTSAPINATAAGVTDGRNEAPFEAKVQEHEPVFDTPPPTRPLPHDIPDLIGVRVGRLVVVGLYAETRSARGKRKPARWVLRCACGAYTLRRTNAVLHDTGEHEPRCPRCDYLRRVQRLYTILPPRDFKS